MIASSFSRARTLRVAVLCALFSTGTYELHMAAQQPPPLMATNGMPKPRPVVDSEIGLTHNTNRTDGTVFTNGQQTNLWGDPVISKPEESRARAEVGNAPAQFNMGVRYDNGDGVPQDYHEAVRWYKMAADQGYAAAQYNLGVCYYKGEGVPQNPFEAVKWYLKAAEQGDTLAQYNLGSAYENGDGAAKDSAEAFKWWREAAEHGFAKAAHNLGFLYYNGKGVAKDWDQAIKWWRVAAEEGEAGSQYELGICYSKGEGAIKDNVEAYKWYNLAAAQGYEDARHNLTILEGRMTAENIAEGQRLAREFRPSTPREMSKSSSSNDVGFPNPTSSGTGFFITEDGFLITNAHVVKDAKQIRLVTSGGIISATVIKLDSANDLALVKGQGKFATLPVTTSRTVRLGNTVAPVGFPNIGLQGFSPKLAKGEIAALSGALDDPRYFQVSLPLQPGNSGGALVDERGNVVGVVSAKLDALTALATSGALPENVNYAVKSSFLLSFLESVPDVTAKLSEPNAKDRKFEDVVTSAEQSAVLVVVY